MRARPRILMLTTDDHADARSGGPLRTSNVAARLQAEVGDVDVIHLLPTVGIRRGPGQIAHSAPASWRERLRRHMVVRARMLKYYCPETRARFSADVLKLLSDVGTDAYQLLIVEYSSMMIYSGLLDIPVVADLHNIESRLLANLARSKRPLRRVQDLKVWLWATWNARQLRRLERAIGARSSGVSLVSSVDLDEFVTMSVGNVAGDVVVAPNGVAARNFEAGGERTASVVFVGFLGWQPNTDACRWLARSVWPHVQARVPHAKLQLIGRQPGPAVYDLAGLNVEVIADVPDVLPYVAAATVATAPLLAAGGTRLKILEALAAGTPVVATSMGALGLESLAGPFVDVVDDPEDFARALVDRLSAPAPTDRVSCRQAVQPYRWDLALEPLVRMCGELTADSRSAQAKPARALQ